MRVILKEDVQNLGDMGDIVNVSDGFGRNFLIPQGLALHANEKNAKQFAHQRSQIERQKEKLRAVALGLVGELANQSVTIPRQVGDDDKLFGSVTRRDIENAFGDQGFEVSRKKIQLRKPIKELGVYKVEVKLHADVRAEVRVWVTRI